MPTLGSPPEGAPGVSYIMSVPGIPGPPGSTFTINGDGTFTFTDHSDSALVDNGDGTFTLTV